MIQNCFGFVKKGKISVVTLLFSLWVTTENVTFIVLTCYQMGSFDQTKGILPDNYLYPNFTVLRAKTSKMSGVISYFKKCL